MMLQLVNPFNRGLFEIKQHSFTSGTLSDIQKIMSSLWDNFWAMFGPCEVLSSVIFQTESTWSKRHVHKMSVPCLDHVGAMFSLDKIPTPCFKQGWGTKLHIG